MAKSKAKGGSAGKYHFEGKDLEYYNALLQAKAEVAHQMRFHSEGLDCSDADKRGVTTHMADISSDNSRHEMELRMLSEDGDVLKLIDAAIERLAKGEYGKCQECGKPIPEGRLKVRPYAVFCIECKTRREEMAKR